MQPRFFILPVLAFLLFVLGLGLRQYVLSQTWLYVVSSSLAAFLLAFWIYSEYETIRRVWEGKRSKQNLGRLLILLLVLGVVVLSNRPRFNRSFDLSDHQDNSLSKQSKTLIERLLLEKKSIHIKGFFVSAKIQRNFKKILQRYLEQGAPITIDFIDPQLDIVSAKANKVEQAHVAIFESDGKQERIVIFNEESISNAILKLLIEDSFNIYFLSGNGEPSISSDAKTGIKLAADALRGEGYNIETINLSTTEVISSKADLLVISGPKVNIPVVELRKLANYIRKGGALLVLLDAMRPSDSVNQLLEPFGLSYNNDFIVLSSDDPKVKIYGQNAAVIDTISSRGSMGLALFNQGDNLFFSDTRSLAQVSQDRDIFFPLRTDAKALQINEVYSEDDLVDIEANRLRQGTHKLMAMVRIKPEADASTKNYIAAFGSSQFIQNDKFNVPGNREVFLKTISFILRKDYFISLSDSRRSSKGTLEIDSRAPVIVLGILCFIYPFGYLLIGALIWYRRKQA